MAATLSCSLRSFWEGCLFSSIAHAVAVSRLPDISNEQSWDNSAFSVQDSMGGRGTVCFKLDEIGMPLICAGVVFTQQSPRKQLVSGMPLKPESLFSNVNSEHLTLVEEASQYALEDFDGQILPWITAGFWSDAETLVSNDPWSVFLLHGGYLFERQFSTLKTAIGSWTDSLTLSSNEIQMTLDLFHQKVANPREWLSLSPQQLSILEANEVGLDQSWESFAELRIKFPSNE